MQNLEQIEQIMKYSAWTDAAFVCHSCTIEPSSSVQEIGLNTYYIQASVEMHQKSYIYIYAKIDGYSIDA